MLSQLGCADEDNDVDPQLGYPPAYPKLCRHDHVAGLPIPYTEGPPQRFLPYSTETEDLKLWDKVFPVVAGREKGLPNTRKFAEELWQQLEHLGNAGFDPAKFRVDPYGNVVHWNADPSSPLAWDVDLWFPYSRGGRTKLPNLRIVQWQAYLRKRNRLEFLVPWWDLQHGCSINQFLSAFAAKNADFRKRSFALFFARGEDESVAREHVGECRPWPQPFREKKALCGLAAAALVNVPKEHNVDAEALAGDSTPEPLSSSGIPLSPEGGASETPSKRQWSVEEEVAVKRGVSKFGAGSWKEIKEGDSTLANRSPVQIKEKFQMMRGVSQRNGVSSTGHGKSDLSGRQSAATTALQKELRVKIMREEERREKEEELVQLEETVVKLKVENEKERLKALELESLLKKHKHRVEKQRKWAESQSSYRLCLERVLRDIMHQTMAYKEQARLTQEACNVLTSRLDSQKIACEAIESDLLQLHAQREILEAAAGGMSINDSTALVEKKQVTKGRDIVDVSSCVCLRAIDEDDDEDEENLLMTANKLSESDTEDEGEEEYNLRQEHQQAAAEKSLARHSIKVAIQVDDMKEAVDSCSWDLVPVESKPACPAATSEHSMQSRMELRESDDIAVRPNLRYEADSESLETESDSDFADDEMSPVGYVTKDSCTDDTVLVNELSQFHEGPTSELRDFCSRNSKASESDLCMIDFAFEHSQALSSEPGLDTPIPSAVESKSDSKQEVQKDVIMVQTQSSNGHTAHESIDASPLFRQEYLDELLKQIRFQIPTSEVTGESITDDPLHVSEGHLDELLEKVLTTHLSNIRRSDANRQRQSSELDDEKLRQIGKSNLDKWLRVLLFKDSESAGSSPGRETPCQTNSPTLSLLSVAAMRESLDHARHQECVSRDDEIGERPKSLWNTLVRKLSVKQHTENENALFKRNDSFGVEQPKSPTISKHGLDISDAMKLIQRQSPNDLSAVRNSSNGLIHVEGMRSDALDIGTLPGWPGGIQLPGITSKYHSKVNATDSIRLGSDTSAIWKTERRVEDGVPVHALDYVYPSEKRHYPRPLSDVDEASETESVDNSNKSPSAPVPENHEISRSKKNVSIKVPGFVGRKKASKKSEAPKPLNDDPVLSTME